MPQTNDQFADQTTYLQILSRVSQQLVETWQQSDPGSALSDTLNRILREVAENVIPDQEISASVYIYDEVEGFYSGVARGPLTDYMIAYPPRPGGTAEFIVQNRQPLFVDNVKRMPPGVPPLSKKALEQGIQSLANLPLLIGPVGQQTVIGALIINLQQPHVFDQSQQTLLKLFAGQAAIALQNARIHRRRLLEEQAIQQVSALTTTKKLAQVEDYIAQQAVELTRATYATVWAANPEQSELLLQGRFNTGRHWNPPQTTLPIDEYSINGYVA
ncbi:MAG: GAF domain-containing protein, partial [Chloroflexi bacterium]